MGRYGVSWLFAVTLTPALLLACGDSSGDVADRMDEPTSRATSDDSDNDDSNGDVESEIRSAMNNQIQLLVDREWRELYETFSAEFQSNCAYDQFVNGQAEAANFYSGGEPKIVSINDVEVQGSKAFVQYTFAVEDRDGAEITRFESSRTPFVKEDGAWKEDWNPDDPPSYCG
jgi:hypothetical protein